MLRRAQNDITEIKRQRLENEEEIERLKVMLLGCDDIFLGPGNWK